MITITELVQVTEEPTENSATVWDKYGFSWVKVQGKWLDSIKQSKTITWAKLMKKMGPLCVQVKREVAVPIPTDDEVASGYARGGPFQVAGSFAGMSIRREEFRLWLQKHDEELWAKRNNPCADPSLPKGEVADYGYYGGRALAARGESYHEELMNKTKEI